MIWDVLACASPRKKAPRRARDGGPASPFNFDTYRTSQFCTAEYYGSVVEPMRPATLAAPPALFAIADKLFAVADILFAVADKLLAMADSVLATTDRLLATSNKLLTKENSLGATLTY